jgi:RNA-directed DNA polymerase
MIAKNSVALALADTMLARDASKDGLLASVSWAFEADWPWLKRMCKSIHTRAGVDLHSFSRHELAGLILDNRSFNRAWETKPQPQIRRYCIDPPIQPEPSSWVSRLAMPILDSAGDLARCLNLPPTELDWFADHWRVEPTPQTPLQHYHYKWVAKRSGGMRLIEIPKARLRNIQAKILRGLLDRVPAHEAAHGFRRGYSCLTHASVHTGQRVVVRMDLKDFFAHIPASRIHALFAKLGYRATVAGALTRLCVNRTPSGVLRADDVAGMPWVQRQMFRTPHLPQGSPCSPALANLCAFRLDLRLDALARSLGARYSRYADDLAFSGDRAFERALERFHVHVGAIALEEGFAVNTKKTRMMRAGTRQQLTGVVVNRHPNLARDEFDKLKATLTNCVRHGPDSQNRDAHDNFRAHLDGKVAYASMLNASRGAKLRRMFAAINWPAHQ